MKTQRFVMVLVGLVLTSGLMAQTAIPPSKTLTVAYYQYGALFFNGKGIDKDVSEELARRAGWTLQASVQTRARIWKDLETGSLALATSGVQTPERNKFAWFVPYVASRTVVLIRSDLANTVHSFSDFQNQPGLQFGAVATVRHGVVQDAWLDLLRETRRVQESPTLDVLFRKLKDGRIDALFSQPIIYNFYLKEIGFLKDVVIQDWTPGEPGVVGAMVLSKHFFSAQEATQVGELIQAMKKDGTLLRIFSQYVPVEDGRRLLEF